MGKNEFVLIVFSVAFLYNIGFARGEAPEINESAKIVNESTIDNFDESCSIEQNDTCEDFSEEALAESKKADESYPNEPKKKSFTEQIQYLAEAIQDFNPYQVKMWLQNHTP